MIYNNICLFIVLVILDIIFQSIHVTTSRPFYDPSLRNPDFIILSSAVCKSHCYDRCFELWRNGSNLYNQDSRKSVRRHPASQNVPRFSSVSLSNKFIKEKCDSTYPTFISSCSKSCNYVKMGLDKTSDCKDHCQSQSKLQNDHNGCQLGCQFLSQARLRGFGNCPSSSHDSKDYDGGNVECHIDQQCVADSGILKCCNKRCVVPVSHPESGPNINPPDVKEGIDGLTFIMTWKTDSARLKVSKSSIPIVFYVLQVRIYFGKEFVKSKASQWKTLSLTQLEAAQLNDLKPGMCYEFRLASVTRWGTKGFRTVSPPVRLSKPPSRPLPPRNLTDGREIVNSNSPTSVAVWVQWVPPLYTVPISHYRISWVRDHGFIQSDGRSLESLTNYVDTVPESQTRYTIVNLLRGKTYKVQVQAVSKWDSEILVSRPNTIFISTPKPVKQFPNIQTERLKYSKDHCICPSDNNNDKLDFGTPFIQNDVLKIVLHIKSYNSQYAYRVSYNPRVCINSKTPSQAPFTDQIISAKTQNITLEPLLHNCRYSINIQPLRYRGHVDYNKGDESITSCFCTPPKSLCRTTHRRNYILCSRYNNGRSGSSTNSNTGNPSDSRNNGPDQWSSGYELEPPGNLILQESQKNPYSFLVFWQPSEQSPQRFQNSRNGNSGGPIRYRVMWGPSIDDYIASDLLYLSGTSSSSSSSSSSSASKINKINSGDSSILTPRFDMAQAETKVLKENVHSIWLENLRTNTYYIVEVQSIRYQNGYEQVSKKKMIVLSTHDDPVYQKQLSMQANFHKSAASISNQNSLLSLSIFTSTLIITSYFLSQLSQHLS